MKIYSKIVAKIRNNLWHLDSDRVALIEEQIERVDTFVEENTDMQVDAKVIQTGSEILISNRQISESSKSVLICINNSK